MIKQITITADIAADMNRAGLDDTEIPAYMEAWIDAAERIGAERGYEVVAIDAIEGSPEAMQMTTTWVDEDDDMTVEQMIAQAAHDSVDISGR